MKFSKKIILSILLIQLISTSILMYLNHHQYTTSLHMIIKEKERDTSFLIKNIFANISKEYTAYGNELLADPKIIEAFSKRDREELLKLTMPIYKKLKKQNKYLYIMHFHTHDTKSFLRLHKPEKFEDDLSDLRPIIVKTNKSKVMQSGVEVGKFGVNYRVAFPVFDGDKYIGAFELGIDIKYLMSNISVLNRYAPALIMKKESLAPIYKYDRTSYNYLNTFTKTHSFVKYGHELNGNKLAEELIDKRIISEESYITSKDDKKYLIFHAFDLKDYNNNSIGYFVIIDDVDYYIDTIIFLRLISIATIILLLIITVGLMYRIVLNEEKQQQHLLQQSRLAKMGEMISMIAHQWRQPLSAISATTGDIQINMALKSFDLDTKKGQEEQNNYLTKRLGKIEKLVKNLSMTIDDFRNFYKPGKLPSKTTFENVTAKALDIVQSSLTCDNIGLTYKYDSKEKIDMYDNEVMQVILNILKNAQDNFKEKNTLNPQITITSSKKSLSICDNGGGIAKNIIEKIFDPYFTTKGEQHGTGMGLYMSKTIIEKHHNGTLSIENKNDGVCFTITINGIN